LELDVKPKYRFSRATWLQIFLLLAAAFASGGVCAQQVAMTFSPAITGLTVPVGAATVYTGNIVYTYASGPNIWNITQWYIPFSPGNAMQLAKAGGGGSNLYVEATANPLVLVTGNGCTLSHQPSWSPASGPIIGAPINMFAANCVVTITVPVTISKKDGASFDVPTPSISSYIASPVPNWSGLWNPSGGAACNYGQAGYTLIWYSQLGCNNNTAIGPPISVTNIGCTLSTTEVTVALPTVLDSSLHSAGATAGTTPFQLTLTGCGAGTTSYSVDAQWSFTQSGTSSNVIDTGVKNVGVQILDENQTPVSNGGTSLIAKVTQPGTSYNATYYARYIAVNGAASTGAFSAKATFTLTYD
jgi:major type 1 subunit fimbrin (pilin)